MAIFVDHLGLNTLVSSSLDLTTNTISSNLNGIIKTVPSHQKLAAINTHRNGPYGFATWTQIRAHENPLTRYQNKNSDFTFVTSPGNIINLRLGENKELRVRNRFSTLHSFEEPVVTQKFFPLVWNMGRHYTPGQPAQRFSLLSSYGNQLVAFSNDRVNKLLKMDITQDDSEYEQLTSFYLNGALEEEDSPITLWEFLKYQETVFPRPENMFRKETRDRRLFSSFYKSGRSNRTPTVVVLNSRNEGASPNVFKKGGAFGQGLGNSNLGGTPRDDFVHRSIWPLDAHESFLTRETNSQNQVEKSARVDLMDGAPGILLNAHVQFMENLTGELPLNSSNAADLNIRLTPGPLYARRTSMRVTSSVVTPSGMLIPETGNIGGAAGMTPFEGGALWEAGIQAGKAPFYDDYSGYNSEFRSKYKNFTTIPEFRISNHVENILKSGSAYFENDLFELTGAEVNNSSSANEDFYKTYSTSDFLRHFELIEDDHKDFTDSQVLRVKCKAVKKFLPYDGFYPCQRTVTMAEQYFKSYGANFSTEPTFASSDTQTQIGHQPLITPLFAPGVLFNTIKAGVACDYPVHTEQPSAQASEGFSDRRISTLFDNERIPFEALVVPEDFLSQRKLSNSEAHLSGALSASAYWDGRGDNVYKLMAHNFLAETPEFFLHNENFTSLVSRKQGDPNFGVVEAGKKYTMRIRMYRSMDKTRASVYSGSNPLDVYLPPQDIIETGSARETFTMYSRTSAFGPPTKGVNIIKLTDSNDSIRLFNTHKGEQYLTGGASLGNHDILILDSAMGYNFPFTPPYYHGEAWLDLEYNPTTSGKKTLNEIISELTQSYTRFDSAHYFAGQAKYGTLGFGIPAASGPQAFNYINNQALQITASINPFGKGSIESVDLLDDASRREVNVVVSTESENEARWVIQTKFETPMLNFNHISNANGNLTLPTYASESVPRGMWHQLGKIPDENEGVFLRVGPQDSAWQKKRLGRSELAEDLSEVCGFSSEPVKLGRVATRKLIREAVVAVPFIEESNRKKFFLLDSEAVEQAKTPSGLIQSELGLSIKEQIKKMQRYVFPPSFDFINNPTVEPIAMYIFEFTHLLDQEDLSHIWQNLPPKIGRTHDTSEAQITHPLLLKELLGGGLPGDNTKHTLPDELKWMVFKVKQRAASNYFEKVAASNPNIITRTEASRLGAVAVDQFGATTNVQFNWPYDFFSLVELVRLDVEVEMNNADYTDFKEKLPVPITIQASPPAIVRQNSDPTVPAAVVYTAPFGGVEDPGIDGDETTEGILNNTADAFTERNKEANNRAYDILQSTVKSGKTQEVNNMFAQIQEGMSNLGRDLFRGAYGTTAVLDAFGTIRPGGGDAEDIQAMIEGIQTDMFDARRLAERFAVDPAGAAQNLVDPRDAARNIGAAAGLDITSMQETINSLTQQIQALQTQQSQYAQITPQWQNFQSRILQLQQQRLQLSSLVGNFNLGNNFYNP